MSPCGLNIQTIAEYVTTSVTAKIDGTSMLLSS